MASASALPSGVTSDPFLYCGPVLAGAQPTQARDGAIIYSETYAIRSVQADGTGLTTLYHSDSPIGSPDVSPDGRLIAFDRRSLNEIWVMNRDGSNAHFVAAGTTPSFSPDGKQLAIGGARTDHRYIELDVVNLDGSGRRPIALDATPSPEPSWSPDGTRIAFGSYVRIQLDFPAIKLVGIDGSGEQPLGSGESPSWSPDGTAIAYTEGSARDLPKAIEVVALDRSYRHLVGPRGRSLDAISPAWSPSGRQLIFLRTPAGYESEDGLLWLTDVDGRGRHPIASSCLFGTGSGDHLRRSPRANRLFGLEGNDVIDVRGGRRDVVDCGPGRDSVRADRRDVVARNCERVRRSH